MLIEDKWDQRHWELALKSEKTMEAYSEMRANVRSLKETPTVDDLPQAEQDWLRSS